VNRDDLDAFFAKADDVLDNWRGSDDAMHARVPIDEDAEALPGESYYDQWDSGDVALTRAERNMSPLLLDIELDFSVFNQVMAHIQEQMILFGNAYLRGNHHFAWAPVVATTNAPTRAELDAGIDLTDPRERALQLRRNRNTGPKDRRRLDGRTTRSGATS